MDIILEYRPVIAAIAGIAALLILILRARLNAFLALFLVAILSALGAGMMPGAAFATIQKGMGGTLGFIAPIIGMGALFGATLHASGGVQALADGISKLGGIGAKRWSMGGLGIVAATPVFFDVALIILMPFVKALSKKTGQCALMFGLPLCAGLDVGHDFVPPTPGPIAIAELIGADLGWVIIFGSITGLISVAIAGPLWTGFLAKRDLLPDGKIALAADEEIADQAHVSPLLALGLILLPLILILAGTLATSFFKQGYLHYCLSIIGHPFSALIIVSGVTWAVLRPKNRSGQNPYTRSGYPRF